jgi:hypothetical protein
MRLSQSLHFIVAYNDVPGLGKVSGWVPGKGKFEFGGPYRPGPFSNVKQLRFEKDNCNARQRFPHPGGH